MNTEQAERIARDAHAGRLDRHGVPEIEHIRRVAEAAPSPAKAIAWLHDTVEDGLVTMEFLIEQGLTPVQQEALRLVTRDKRDGLTYKQWIGVIAVAPEEAGQLARATKHADLKDNIGRPKTPEMADINEKRYKPSLAVIETAMRERGEL